VIRAATFAALRLKQTPRSLRGRGSIFTRDEAAAGSDGWALSGDGERCFMVRFDASRSMVLASLLLGAAACSAPFNADLTQGGGGTGGKPAGAPTSSSTGSVMATGGHGGAGGAGGSGAGATGGEGGGEGGAGGAGGMPPMSTACTVVVVDSQNNAVVVNDASGAVVSATQSGPGGSVGVMIPPGGSVTVFDSYQLTFTVVAAVAPPDGSTFRVTAPRPAAPPPPTPTHFHVTATQAPISATSIRFLTSCETDAVPAIGAAQPVATIDGGCTAGALSDTIWALALDGSGTPVAWGSATNLTRPGMTVDLDVAVKQTAFNAMDDQMTSIPAGAAAQIAVGAWTSSGEIGNAPQVAADPAGMSAFADDYLSPAMFAGHFSVVESITLGNLMAASYVTRNRTYMALPAAPAFAGNAMPLVSANALDVADPTHPSATWSVGAGPLGDAARIETSWTGGTSTTWYTVYLPSSTPTAFRLPDMPDAEASFRPTATSVPSAWEIDYIDYETTSKYADVLGATVPVMDGLGTVTTRAAFGPME
jgi:hypothetical protein